VKPTGTFPSFLASSAFTLLEVLVVVIILGILAAIVIPQFTEASNEARESSVASDLQTIRGQLEVYKAQHRGRNASVDENDALDTAANLVLRMIGRTDEDGKINAAGAFGPYLHKFPANPFVNIPVSQVVLLGAADCPGDNTTGWYFKTPDGPFSLNDTEHMAM